MALCAILAFWTRDDAAQMDRLFRQSALMRKKWDHHASYATDAVAEVLGGPPMTRPERPRPRGHESDPMAPMMAPTPTHPPPIHAAPRPRPSSAWGADFSRNSSGCLSPRSRSSTSVS